MNRYMSNDADRDYEVTASDPLLDIDCTIGTNDVRVWNGLVTNERLREMRERLANGEYGNTAKITVTRTVYCDHTDLYE
jgi:hypothetical protein